MEIGSFTVGRRTFLVSTLSLLFGVVLFFNAGTLTDLVTNTLLLVLCFGSLGFFTENFSVLKSVGLWSVILALLGVIFTVSMTGSICQDSLTATHKVAENPVSGEIVHKKFTGSGGGASCRDWSFPWYYQSLNESEKHGYCSENPEKGYCEKWIAGEVLNSTDGKPVDRLVSDSGVKVLYLENGTSVNVSGSSWKRLIPSKYSLFEIGSLEGLNKTSRNMTIRSVSDNSTHRTENLCAYKLWNRLWQIYSCYEN